MSEFLLFGGILEVKKKKKAVRFLSPKRNHCCREVNLSVPSPLPWVQVGSLPDVNQKEVTELHFSAVSQSKPGLFAGASEEWDRHILGSPQQGSWQRASRCCKATKERLQLADLSYAGVSSPVTHKP